MAALPDDFTTRRFADRWVVIGPTGLFLIGVTESPSVTLLEQTAIDAHLLRERLAEALDVVPFVEPVVVSHVTSTGHNACAMVEARHLSRLLLNGPMVIAEAELQLLRHHVPAVLTAMETAHEWG